MHWTLCEAPESSPFITTDNPLALFNPVPGRVEGRTGGPLFQFIWPVNLRFLVFGERRGSGPDDHGRISADVAQTWNDELIKVAHKQVYASFFSKELQTRINRTFKEREPLITPMPADYRG